MLQCCDPDATIHLRFHVGGFEPNATRGRSGVELPRYLLTLAGTARSRKCLAILLS
jgi:hypothetical protein